jgi:2-oxoglutarate decarboxylase
VDPNVFETANAGFAQAMYEEFLRDPNAVGPEWRRLFESGVVGEKNGSGAAGQRGSGADGQRGSGADGQPGGQASRVSTADRLVGTAPQPTHPQAGTRPAAPPSGASPIKGPAAKLVANMTESLTVPTATTFRILPVAVLEDRRKALNAGMQAAGRSGKISFTHLIAYAIVQAAKQQPVMAQTFAMIDGAPHRVQPEGIGLGLAVDVQRKDGSRGLVVPVIKHAETMDFAAFHAAYEVLVEGPH